MPSRPPRWCARCRAPHATPADCPHARPAWAKRSESSRVRGNSRWQRLRKQKLARDPLCAHCGALATEVDHIVPIAAGGDAWDEDNWQSLCSPCHAKKSERDRLDGIARASRRRGQGVGGA